MKRTAMLLVAVLFMVAASSVQAADTALKFFYQVGSEPVDVLTDAHVVLQSGDTVVADSTFDGESYGIEVAVEPGKYTLSVEQEANSFAGTVEIEIVEDQPAMLFFLNVNGLTYLDGYHECKCIDPENVCDKNCVCIFFAENVTEKVCHCAEPCGKSGVAGSSSNGSNVYGSSCATPNAVAPASPFNAVAPATGASGLAGAAGSLGAMGGSWASLGMLGALVAVVAVTAADDDDPKPTSRTDTSYITEK